LRIPGQNWTPPPPASPLQPPGRGGRPFAEAWLKKRLGGWFAGGWSPRPQGQATNGIRGRRARARPGWCSPRSARAAHLQAAAVRLGLQQPIGGRRRRQSVPAPSAEAPGLRCQLPPGWAHGQGDALEGGPGDGARAVSAGDAGSAGRGWGSSGAFPACEGRYQHQARCRRELLPPSASISAELLDQAQPVTQPLEWRWPALSTLALQASKVGRSRRRRTSRSAPAGPVAAHDLLAGVLITRKAPVAVGAFGLHPAAAVLTPGGGL